MALGGFWAKFYRESFAFWKLPPQLRSVMAQKSCGYRSGLWEEAALVWYKICQEIGHKEQMNIRNKMS